MTNKDKKAVGIIGHFAFGLHFSDGQTVKTRTFADAIEERTCGSILKEDTHGGAKTLFRLPFQLYRLLSKCDSVLILPAQRGLRFMAPLLSLMNRFFHRKLHYCVVGGWLPSLIRSRRGLCRRLKRFTGIHVETNTVKKALEAMGFSNVDIIPNCKSLDIMEESKLKHAYSEPYRLCTFSRVMREKGIEDAVNAVERLNRENGKTVCTLDIYGQVDPAQKEWFEQISSGFSDDIRYRGVAPYDQSVSVLRDYFALLFPTRFYTEGVPGTIIDAYAAGLPVIAARWESFSDIIDDGTTGIGYPFEDTDGLYTVLSDVCANPLDLVGMKVNCLHRASDFRPENALKPLFEQIGV